MKDITFIIPVFFLVFTCSVISGELVLKIQAPADTILLRESTTFIVTITNQGEDPVTLVDPGDGSVHKMRTPIVGWSVVLAEEYQGKNFDEPLLKYMRRCANINPITIEEIFTLKPGETRTIDGWIGKPIFPRPGKYHVAFYYENIPSMPVFGIPLGRHDPGAIEKIRQSDPYVLKSNKITVEVCQMKNIRNKSGSLK